MIKTLSLKNWKTHEDTELDFRKGANVIIGEMGTGKTSALEAVSYALFGTYPSLRSQKNTLDQTIMNNPVKKNKAEVKLSFTANGDTYTVKRKIERGKGTTESELRKEEELLEGPSTVKVTDAVEKILKMDYDLFSKAVYTEQNQMDYFLEIRKGKRKEQIDQLLELERWEEHRKKLGRVLGLLEERARSEKEKARETEELKQIPEIKEGLKKIEEKIKEDNEKYQELKSNLEKKKEKYREMKEKAEKHKELKRKVDKHSERVKYLEGDLEKLPKAEDIEGVEGKIRELREKREKVREKEKKLNSIKTKIQTAEERISKLEKKKESKEKELRELEVNEKAKEELERVKGELEEIQRKVSEAKAEKESLSNDIEEEKEHLEKLRGEETECPVCGTELTGGKKERVVREKKEEIKRLLEGRKSKENRVRELLEKRNSEKERKENLEKEMKKLEEKKELEKDLKELEKELEEEENSEKELKKELDSIEITEKEEDLEKKVKHEEKKKEYLEKLSEKKKVREKLKEEKEKLEGLEFHEEEFQELYDELKSLDKKESLVKQEIKSKKELMDERKKSLKNLEKQKEEKEKAKEKAKYIESQLNHLKIFQSSLNRMQSYLRERFVKETNSALNMLWGKLYPYRNYEDIRLNIDEDGDYVLEVKELNGEWMNVEGRTSGGERSTASLCLRVSLALVLTNELSWIVLDEPTHNLDENAISELSVALGDYLPELVEQVFVITHEKGLKEASSGTFHRFSRNKEENEPTVVDTI